MQRKTKKMEIFVNTENLIHTTYYYFVSRLGKNLKNELVF
jgi:hypothetical protein